MIKSGIFSQQLEISKLRQVRKLPVTCNFTSEHGFAFPTALFTYQLTSAYPNLLNTLAVKVLINSSSFNDIYIVKA